MTTKRAIRTAEAKRDLGTVARLRAHAVKLEADAHGMQGEAEVLKIAAERLIILAGLARKPPKRH